MEKRELCWSRDLEEFFGCFETVCDRAFDDLEDDADLMTLWEGELGAWIDEDEFFTVDNVREIKVRRTADGSYEEVK